MSIQLLKQSGIPNNLLGKMVTIRGDVVNKIDNCKVIYRYTDINLSRTYSELT